MLTFRERMLKKSPNLTFQKSCKYSNLALVNSTGGCMIFHITNINPYVHSSTSYYILTHTHNARLTTLLQNFSSDFGSIIRVA